MCSLKYYEQILKNTGFVHIMLKERHAWYLNTAKNDLDSLDGPLKNQVIEVIGIEETNGAIDIWKKLIGVLEIGEHRPGHFQAVKK